MHASLLLATLQASALTVAPGPSDSCPNSAQVLAALQTHAPALVNPRVDDDAAKLLTLTLLPPPASGQTSFSLIDKDGLVKLYRSLPAPAGDRAHDCAALADSVAFIVLRYFEEVELPALPERKPPPPAPVPPPPTPAEKPSAPAPPQAEKVEKADKPVAPPVESAPTSEPAEPSTVTLSGHGGRRFPGDAHEFGGYEAKLTLGLLLTGLARDKGDLWLDVSGGFAGHASIDATDRPGYQATSTRWSGELALLAGWRLGSARLYAGPLASVDVILIDAKLAGHAQSERRFPPAAGFRIGYQYFWFARVFLRADLTADVALVRERVVTQSKIDFFEAPRAYATLSLGLGVGF